MKLAQKPKHSEKNLPLSTTNPTQPGLESSLGLCGDTDNQPPKLWHHRLKSFHILSNRLHIFKININSSSIVFSNHYIDITF